MNPSHHRLPWTWPVESRLLLAFLVLAPALTMFTNLASELARGNAVAFDRWLLQQLRSPADPRIPIGPEWLLEAMIDWTALGAGSVVALITISVAGYLIAARKAALGLFLAAAIAAGGIFNKLLKFGFDRERPDVVPHLVEVGSASFPSGHAMNSAMVYLTLGALLASAERGWQLRLFLMAAAMMITLVVGFSRVYLGVHYPTDVLAGWSVGAAWAVACSLIGQRLQRQASGSV